MCVCVCVCFNSRIQAVVEIAFQKRKTPSFYSRENKNSTYTQNKNKNTFSLHFRSIPRRSTLFFSAYRNQRSNWQEFKFAWLFLPIF